MASRVATLDYRVTGAEGATTRVRTLAQAMAEQKRNAASLQPALLAAQRGNTALGAASQAGAAQIMALSSALGPLGAGLAAAALRAPQAALGLASYAAQAERATVLSRAVNAAVLGGAATMTAAGIASVAYAGNILRGADAYASLSSRLKIFSADAQSAAANEAALFATAREARTSVEGLGVLFTRVTPAISDMGRAQSDALKITESVSKALAIQGATTAEASAATVQFAQALASGVLRGDELKSMMESSPQLLRYIATNLEMSGSIGVAFGQLRKLGEEGKLSAEKLVEALLRAGPKIEADFANAPKTAAQGWQVLQDTIMRTTGQLAQTAGLQDGVFGFLSDLSDRLDGFREKVLLDPSILDPAIDAAELFGETLEIAGDIAGGVAENFDLIVTVAQALIALKAGEVMANGFAAAIAKAKELERLRDSFRANGVYIAGAGAAPELAASAQGVAAASAAADAKALNLRAQAEDEARRAVFARTAADAASAEVTAMKARAGVVAAEVSTAEARASALVAAAEKGEAAAKALATKATDAETAATTRAAIAKAGYAAVAAQVNTGQALLAAGTRALAAAYAFIGGPIGLATIALGALAFMTIKNIQAQQNHEASVRSNSRAIARLTADIALQKKAKEELGPADAKVVNSMDAEVRQAAELTGELGKLTDQYYALAAARKASLLSDLYKDRNEARKAGAEAWTNLEFERRRQRGLAQRGGANAASVAEQRLRGTAEWKNFGEAARVGAAIDRQIAEMEARKLDDGFVERNTTAAVSSGSSAASKADAATNAIRSLLEQIAAAAEAAALMGQTAGASSFDVVRGVAMAGDTPLSARSEDEARAIMAYVEQVETVRKASAGLIAETGLTREALEAQAAQTLATALATSQAAQAQTRWEERLAAARGESTAVAQAEKEVAEARRQGADITEEAVQAYLNLIRAQEAQRRSEAALQRSRPVVDDVTREELDAMGRVPERWRPDAGAMGIDVEAALAQWAAARERILAESDRRVRENYEKSIREGRLTAEEASRQMADDIAANRVAVEAVSAEQVADIWRRLRDEDRQAWDDRLQERLDQERELADAVTGALEDLALGGDAVDIGRQLGEDLLRSIWQELVSNPLNLMIKTTLRSLLSGDGTGGSGGFWSSVMSAFGFGGGGTTTTSPVSTGGVYRDGGLPGFDQGGLVAMALRPGLIRGPGGPRDDRILARVSTDEYIVNASATKRHFQLLEALNSGRSVTDALSLTPGFAAGGLPGGVMADMLSREILSGDAGYVYTPQAAESDRSSAEASRGGPSGDLVVNIKNETGEPIHAEVSRTPQGFDMSIMRDAVRSEINRSGSDGSLAKALGKTPPKRRR